MLFKNRRTNNYRSREGGRMSKIDNSLFQMQILLADAKKRNAPDVIVQAFEDSVKALELFIRTIDNHKAESEDKP